jgi:AraC-like DNA-binding protein
MLSCLKDKILNQTLSMDQTFLNRLSEIVDANLENENFGPPDIYHALGMSRSSIHRKLISMNQQSLCHFIQEKRLHKAMEMLRRNMGTASEIAFRTGFSSPEYFNRCFHNFFGYPPGEAKKLESNGHEKATHFVTPDTLTFKPDRNRGFTRQYERKRIAGGRNTGCIYSWNQMLFHGRQYSERICQVARNGFKLRKM